MQVAREPERLDERMRFSRIVAFHFLLVVMPLIAAQETGGPRNVAAILAEMRELEASGDFIAASSLSLDGLGARDVGLVLNARERLRRIRRDYPLTRSHLVSQLTASVVGFDEAEFDRLVADGRFDRRTIDGEVRFARASRSNLFFRHPEFSARRKNPSSDDAFARVLLDHIDAVKRAAADGAGFVLPRSMNARMSVTVHAEAAKDARSAACWLPIPKVVGAQQSGGTVRAATPSPLHVGEATAPMRTVYFERRVRGDGPIVFELEYDVTSSAVVPGAVSEAGRERLEEADITRFLSEQPPHVVFTPAIRDAARRIAGDATDPVVLARRFYEWIGNNIVYSYSTEYSNTPNISAATLERRWGDCGEAGLLFITFCRLHGIPARFESGWATWPGHETMHDWTKISLDRKTWIPVDPYMAVFAKTRPAAERAKLRDFYFGGLDAHRLVFNSEHSAEFTPAKRDGRADDVDSQRGEVEVDGRAVYFDGFDYNLEILDAP